jgi:hypothetical protein
MLVPWHVPQPSAFWRRDLFDRFGTFRADMHYAFDAEFMLRLAYAGEFPELLSDQFLSTRSVHPEQKTFEMTNSWPEIDRFAEIFKPELTRGERGRMRAVRALGLGNHPHDGVATSLARWVVNPMRRRLIHPIRRAIVRFWWTVHPVVIWGGDLLEHVPERWRPPIRTRDRMKKRAERAASSQPPQVPVFPPSPIGLEPVDRDQEGVRR